MHAIQFCPVHVAFLHVVSLHYSATNWPPQHVVAGHECVYSSIRGDAGLQRTCMFWMWTPYLNPSNFILKSNILLLENWQTNLTRPFC